MKRECPNCHYVTLSNDYYCSTCGSVLPSIHSGKIVNAPGSTSNPNLKSSQRSVTTTKKTPPQKIIKSKRSTQISRVTPTKKQISSQKGPSGSSSVTKTPPSNPVHHPLPKSMNGYGPCLVEGKVVDIGQTQNVDRQIKAGDVIELGLKTALLFTDTKYGLMSWALSSKKPKEYKTIGVIRIESPTKGTVDIRIEKDMIGVSINICDYISVWGNERAGVFVMDHGFNHTVNGEIRLK